MEMHHKHSHLLSFGPPRVHKIYKEQLEICPTKSNFQL